MCLLLFFLFCLHFILILNCEQRAEIWQRNCSILVYCNILFCHLVDDNLCGVRSKSICPSIFWLDYIKNSIFLFTTDMDLEHNDQTTINNIHDILMMVYPAGYVGEHLQLKLPKNVYVSYPSLCVCGIVG